MDDSPGEEPGFVWLLRVRWNGGETSTVYTRNNAFTVGPPASFRERDTHPSAVEYLLGALGADLTNGFQKNAQSEGIILDALEMALSGRLEHPLAYIGVIGEPGNPYLSDIEGSLYVSTQSDAELVQAAWRTTLERSPVANTLRRGTAIRIELRLID